MDDIRFTPTCRSALQRPIFPNGTAQCADNEFLCPRPHNECIRKELRCDGYSDCLNGEDETGCPPTTPTLPSTPSMPSSASTTKPTTIPPFDPDKSSGLRMLRLILIFLAH